MGLLLDNVTEAAKTNHRGPVCSIAALDLPKEIRADLEVLLKGSEAGTVIARELTNLGYPVKSGVIQKHRRGECSHCK